MYHDLSGQLEECYSMDSVIPECNLLENIKAHSNNELLANSNIVPKLDIRTLDTEIVYIPRNDKFQKWLAITKCDKCLNRYGFYEIDYDEGPWALYCPSPDH